MSRATIVDEPSVPSPRRTWRTDRHLRYDVAMSTIIIILITDVVLHMTLRAHKIPLDDNCSYHHVCLCLSLWSGESTWGNFVKQPQPTIAIV
ncbi:hypothetical protein Bca4012_083411 [Brassica carinata]|uniref:Uncharacterized protein n=1 Tax=Brassica carinata TaxID=52824 RepID=A0A8X7SIE3_BRACI|nr:hypothetical protein Bca52824_027342 [Brassica carinata]